MRKLIIFTLSIMFVFAFVPTANADELPGGETVGQLPGGCTDSVTVGCDGQNPPTECEGEVDYLNQVIWTYQDQAAVLENDVAHWREAHDRVAAYAVERQEEYADLQTEYRKLYDKFVWKSDRVQQLKLKIAILKASR